MLKFIKNMIVNYKERREEQEVLKAFKILDELKQDGIYYNNMPTEEQEVALLKDIQEDNKQKYLH